MFTDPTERTKAIGIWTASLSTGIALGPIVGGLLLEAFWWGSVFLINVPIILALLIAAPLLVPEYRTPAKTRLDLVNVVLAFLAILPVVWAIKAAAEELTVTLPVWIALGVGLVSAVVFVVRQRQITYPLVDIDLFTNPRFTGAIIGAGLAMFALVGVMLYKAQYLQLVAGLPPLTAGLTILPVMVAVGVMAVLSSTLVQRFGYATAFGIGAAVATAGMFVFSRVPADGGLTLAIIASAFIGAGIAPMMTLATDVVVGSAPPERSGAASALSETASEFGTALGIAVLGSIGTALYRSHVLDGIPSDVPSEATETIGSSLGTAISVAEQLPTADAEHLAGLAQQAFIEGLGLATVVGGVFLVLATIACPVLIHRGSQPGQHQ